MDLFRKSCAIARRWRRGLESLSVFVPRQQARPEAALAPRPAESAQEALRESEQRYRTLFENMGEGFALHEILTDAAGVAIDYRFLAANPAFERLTGLTLDQILGKRVREVLPAIEDHWIERYGQVALTGEPVRFESHSPSLGRWYDVYAYRPAPRQFAVVFSDITARKQMEESLHQARRDAERLAQAKADFLSSMSHEIRTPLHGVLGLAQVGYRDGQDEAVRGIFAHILDSGRLLTRVIDDILDFSKIDAGRLQIDAQPMKLRPLLDRVIELIAESAAGKGLALHLESGADLPAACICDPLRLEQILLNLLSNAVKFTERGSVNLSVRREEAALVFRVTDTGIGIAADQLPQLFQPFQQAEGCITTRKYGGSGLGLAISRRLATMMGGELAAESRPGVGSIFALRLPLLATTEQAVAEAEAALLESWRPGADALAGLRILAAEDNAVNQVVIEDALVPEGAEVVIAANGAEAIDEVRQAGARSFDLVLMDIGMPEVDGYEATRHILELAPDLPVIGLTGFATAEDRQRCFAAGMVDHVTKPFDFQTLINAVLRHSGRSSASPAAPPAASAPAAAVTAAASPAGAPLIDWAALSRRCGDRPAALAKILQATLTTQANTAARLRATAQGGDSGQMAALCHEVAGMAGMIDAHGLWRQAKAAEALARGSDPLAMARLGELADAVTALLREIDEGLAGRP